MERSEKISDENIVASECVMNQQDFYPLVFCSAFRRFSRPKGPQKFHRLLGVCRHPPSSPRVSAGTSSRWPCDATAAGSRNDVH